MDEKLNDIRHMTPDIQKFYFDSAKLFESLPKKDRDELEKGVRRKKIKAGKIIYREGSVPKGIYMLRKGMVKIFQTTQDGRTQIMYIYVKGEMFGYRPIICGEMHPVSASALEDCSYDFIPRAHFMECLMRSQQLSHALLVSMSHEFSVYVNNITIFANYPVRSRIAMALLILREKYGEGNDINLSRNDLAAYTGTVKESAVRVLQELKQKRVVETKGRKIKVLNTEVLWSLVSFY